jgi:plasmid replication initiation protein
LREKLGIEKNEYKLFADFRVKCIQIAVKEINENNDIHIIQVDYPTTGRKVSHIVFHCEKSKQTQLNVSEPVPTLIEVKKEHPDDVRELITM